MLCDRLLFHRVHSGALKRNLQSAFAAAAEKGLKEGATTPPETQVRDNRVVLSCIPNAVELKRI